MCIGDVALERDAVPPRAEAEGPRGQAVDAVGADHDRRGRGCSVEADRAPVVVQLERGGAQPVPEVRACRRGLGGEVRVEAAPLGHQHKRPLASPDKAGPVAEAELEAVDHLLDDGIDGDRQLFDRALGQPAAARLVAREAGPVEQEHLRPGAREPVSGGRAGRPGPDDDHIELLHRPIVRDDRSEETWEPRRHEVTATRGATNDPDAGQSERRRPRGKVARRCHATR